MFNKNSPWQFIKDARSIRQQYFDGSMLLFINIILFRNHFEDYIVMFTFQAISFY